MIIRTKHDSENFYTVISNDTLRNARLKPDELGVLCYCLSFNDEWQFHTGFIAQKFGVNDATIRRILNKLEEKGFLHRERIRLKGQFVKLSFTVFETGNSPHVKSSSVEEPPAEEPSAEEPSVEEPPVEEPPVAEPPVAEPPVAELPVKNSQLSNNKESNNKGSNNKGLSSQKTNDVSAAYNALCLLQRSENIGKQHSC